MSVEENKAVVRRGYEALSRGDWAALRALSAPNFIDHSPVQGQGPGAEGFLQSRIALMSALTDFKSTIEDMVAEGDKVAVRLTNSCVHRGEVWGLRPTNKRVTYTETTIWRIVDAKYTDRWCNTDTLSLTQQLGGIPGR
jgi:predicted ester cyclase